MARRRLSSVVLACVAALALGCGASARAAEAPAPAGEKPADVQPAGELEVLADENGDITLLATNADPQKVAKVLSEKGGWPVRLEPEPKGTLTLTLVNETFEQVLVAIARALNYTASRYIVMTPRKEGQALPDRFRLPMDLPAVSLKIAQRMPLAGVVAALKNAAQLDVEVAEELKGEVTLQAAETPLPEVLDSLCNQVGAVWTLAYRLKPTPEDPKEKTPGALGEPKAAEEDQQPAEQWAEMTPEERQKRVRQHTSALLRANPAERKRQVRALVEQVRELARTLAPLTGDERAKLARELQYRAEPYLNELNQLSPEQRRDLEPLIQAFQRVLGVVRGPQPGQRQDAR